VEWSADLTAFLPTYLMCLACADALKGTFLQTSLLCFRTTSGPVFLTSNHCECSNVNAIQLQISDECPRIGDRILHSNALTSIPSTLGLASHLLVLCVNLVLWDWVQLRILGLHVLTFSSRQGPPLELVGISSCVDWEPVPLGVPVWAARFRPALCMDRVLLTSTV